MFFFYKFTAEFAFGVTALDAFAALAFPRNPRDFTIAVPTIFIQLTRSNLARKDHSRWAVCGLFRLLGSKVALAIGEAVGLLYCL